MPASLFFGGHAPERQITDVCSKQWGILLGETMSPEKDCQLADKSGNLSAMTGKHDPKWKFDGVRVVHSNELDLNTAQTPGMNRAAAITHARTGAEKLWAGTVVIHPKAKTGAHHHGPVESVIYVVSGKARMRWGEQLELTAEDGPGRFIFVPEAVPLKEITAW